MQTQTEIREMLTTAGLAPRRQFGQNFLIDKNLMGLLLETADLPGGQRVLEVGPGTGSLTEELLERAAKVVAVEIDRGLAELLRKRLGARENFELIEGDVLSGKHALNPAVTQALGPAAHMVANLPYNIATPLIAECLVASWRASHGNRQGLCLFERLTFTVQRELADRLSASPGRGDYGPVSVLVALLGRIRRGPAVPASAFWPRPKVASRIMRIDFDPEASGKVRSIDVLVGVVALAFRHRRKQIGSIRRSAGEVYGAAQLDSAFGIAGINRTMRPEQVGPGRFLAMANALTDDD